MGAYCQICTNLGYTHTTKEPAMNKQTSPQHRAEPSAETLAFWQREERLKTIYGVKPVILPGQGQHRAPSVMAVESQAAA